MKTETISRQVLVDELKDKLEYLTRIYQAHGVFDCFKAHLEAENPEAGDLKRFIEAKLEVFIKTLNVICLRETLKGKCPACPD